jgi:HEAT repeat protein
MASRTPSNASCDADHDIEEMIKDLSKSQVSCRYQAAERLATFGARAQPALEALSKAVLRDDNALVRKSAAFALGSLATSAAFDALILASEKDEDRFVRERAEQALKECRATSSQNTLRRCEGKRCDSPRVSYILL